jgi:hypothetical protein
MNEKLDKKVSSRRSGAGSLSKLISLYVFFLSFMAEVSVNEKDES